MFFTSQVNLGTRKNLWFTMFKIYESLSCTWWLMKADLPGSPWTHHWSIEPYHHRIAAAHTRSSTHRPCTCRVQRTTSWNFVYIPDSAKNTSSSLCLALHVTTLVGSPHGSDYWVQIWVQQGNFCEPVFLLDYFVTINVFEIRVYDFFSFRIRSCRFLEFLEVRSTLRTCFNMFKPMCQ